MPSYLKYEPITLEAAFKELFLSPSADGTLSWVDLSKVKARAPKARKPTDKVIVAGTQIQIPRYDKDVSTTEMLKGYVHRAVTAVEKAVHENGADVVLLSELFCAPYFCQSQNEACLTLAVELSTSSLVKTFQALAKKLSVVLPLSRMGPEDMPTARPTSLTAPVTRRSFISHLVTPASRFMLLLVSLG
jgi:hypothetical protein